MRRQHSKGEKTVGVIAVALLSPVWIPLAMFVLSLWAFYGLMLHIAVWFWWQPRGKDVLFVYSDSPIWRDYMLEKVLPAVRERAVLLNWSERKRWKRSLATRLFWYFAGDQSFNPMVMLIRPFRFPQRFRYWEPFKLYKHGQPEAVEQLTQQLLLRL
jgi:hypothetical protein